MAGGFKSVPISACTIEVGSLGAVVRVTVMETRSYWIGLNYYSVLGKVS